MYGGDFYEVTFLLTISYFLIRLFPLQNIYIAAGWQVLTISAMVVKGEQKKSCLNRNNPP
jgi:hypothetical protein